MSDFVSSMLGRRHLVVGEKAAELEYMVRTMTEGTARKVGLVLCLLKKSMDAGPAEGTPGREARVCTHRLEYHDTTTFRWDVAGIGFTNPDGRGARPRIRRDTKRDMGSLSQQDIMCGRCPAACKITFRSYIGKCSQCSHGPAKAPLDVGGASRPSGHTGADDSAHSGSGATPTSHILFCMPPTFDK